MSERTQALVWRFGVAACLLWGASTIVGMNWAPIADSWLFLLTALGRSWLLAIISILIGGIAAIPLALARVYGPVGIRHVAIAAIETVRAIPELMIIFWLYFTLPLLTGNQITSWQAAIAALSVIAAAYLAEIVRAGLLSVPAWTSGWQRWLSACPATARSAWSCCRRRLPTCCRRWGAQLVASFKGTSLVYAIGVMEFFRAVNVTNNTLFAHPPTSST